MPYICPNPRLAEEHAASGDCVALIQATVPGLRGIHPSGWREGAPVAGETRIARGTAIATFEDGRYAARRDRDQAAIFLAHAGTGIWVLEECDGDDSPTVRRSFIPAAQATFSVIELGG
jgi:hypothetical protein